MGELLKIIVLVTITTCTATEIPEWKKLNCKPCSAGHYMVTACTEMNGKSVCKPCKTGTFNSKSDLSTSCEDCKVCELTEVIDRKCTTTSNTVCGCPSGTHWVSVGATGYCAKA